MSYRMSFTNGGLFYRESLALLELYNRLRSWDEVKDRAFVDNLLQSRTLSSAKRNIREVCARLQALTPEQLEILNNGGRQDQLNILWLSVCKLYQLVREFSQEVIREKFLRMNIELTYHDYDVFFNAKAEWDDNLEALTETTSKKLRQVVFRLLREADIISKGDIINPIMLSRPVAEAIVADDPAYLSIFPISDLDIQEWSR